MTYQEAIYMGVEWRRQNRRASQERIRRVAYAFAKAWADHPRSDTHLAQAFLAGAA